MGVVRPVVEAILSRPVLPYAGLVDQQVYRGKSEYLAIRRLKQSSHILTADFEAPPSNAGDHIVAMPCLVAQGSADVERERPYHEPYRHPPLFSPQSAQPD